MLSYTILLKLNEPISYFIQWKAKQHINTVQNYVLHMIKIHCLIIPD